MKRFITILVCTCCLLVVHPFNSIAQTDSLSLRDSTAVAEHATPAPDDEFDIFLMVLGIGFFGAVLGAAAVGAFMAALFLLLAVLFVSLGIISASFIVGLYKKSFSKRVQYVYLHYCNCTWYIDWRSRLLGHSKNFGTANNRCCGTCNRRFGRHYWRTGYKLYYYKINKDCQ